jgi:hypothetical protein
MITLKRMVRAMSLALIIQLVLGAEWDIKRLQLKDPLPESVTLKDMQDRGTIQYLEWGWLFNGDQPHHSRNLWHDVELEGNITTLEQAKEERMKDSCFVRGTTLWINEHMVVGHIMYDIIILQLLDLADVKIDRIVLQRAPCMNADLCAGVGTWDGWFKGFFIALMDAFATDHPIPVYMRFAWQDKHEKPVCLGHKYVPKSETPCERNWFWTAKAENQALMRNAMGKDGKPNSCWEEVFFLQSVKAFEKIFKRNCNGCFANGISEKTVKKFKNAAYKLTLPFDGGESGASGKAPSQHFTADAPIVVTLAHRGPGATRSINNIEFLIDTLRHLLRPPVFDFRVYMTSNNTRGYAEQMVVAMESQIMIAEHGAWQSQMIYMRNGSFWIDMHGDYKHGEFQNFEKLARVFGLYYDSVTTKGLTFHPQDDFAISKIECLHVAKLALQYAQDRPFMHNVA